VAALRQALLDSVTEQDMQAVALALLVRAKAGDVAAAKLLLAYALGKPAESVDPDTLDLREWLLFQQGPAQEQDLAAVLGGLPPALACTVARAALPAIEGQLAGLLAQALAPPAAEKAGEAPPKNGAVPEAVGTEGRGPRADEAPTTARAGASTAGPAGGNGPQAAARPAPTAATGGPGCGGCAARPGPGTRPSPANAGRRVGAAHQAVPAPAPGAERPRPPGGRSGAAPLPGGLAQGMV
jgi:hypothetical protein